MGEREEKCTKFLSDLLDGELGREELHFLTWKSVVFVENPEKYRAISKKLNENELEIGRDGYPSFDIRIPADMPGMYWGIRLKKDVDKFLERYGKEYKISWL